MKKLDKNNFDEAFNTLLTAAIEKYNLRVIITDNKNLELENKNNVHIRGAFNEESIFIIRDTDTYERLFVLIHSIGHIAQWINDPIKKDFSFDFQEKSSRGLAVDIESHHQIELESAQYSISFLEEAKVRFLKKWFLQYFEADQAYIEEYLNDYQYGGVKRFKEWLMVTNPISNEKIKPLPLPIFDKKIGRDKKLIFII